MDDLNKNKEKRRKNKKGKYIGLCALLFLISASSGFAAIKFGVLSLENGPVNAISETEKNTPLHFLEIPTINLSLSGSDTYRHLRIALQVEITPESSNKVKNEVPRLLNVFSTYLRALDVQELAAPESMERLRAQLLRRAQVISGHTAVHDLLITEFILN